MRAAGPAQAVDQAQCADAAELRVEPVPGDDELADPVRGRPVERVAATVDELTVGLAEGVGLGDQVGHRVGVTAAAEAIAPARRWWRCGPARKGQRGPDGVRHGGHGGAVGSVTSRAAVSRHRRRPRVGAQRAVRGGALRGECVQGGLLTLDALFGGGLGGDAERQRRVEHQPRHLAGMRPGIGQRDLCPVADAHQRDGGTSQVLRSRSMSSAAWALS